MWCFFCIILLIIFVVFFFAAFSFQLFAVVNFVVVAFVVAVMAIACVLIAVRVAVVAAFAFFMPFKSYLWFSLMIVLMVVLFSIHFVIVVQRFFFPFFPFFLLCFFFGLELTFFFDCGTLRLRGSLI